MHLVQRETKVKNEMYSFLKEKMSRCIYFAKNEISLDKETLNASI